MIKNSDPKDRKKLNTDEELKDGDEVKSKSEGKAFSKMMKYISELINRVEGIKDIIEDKAKKDEFAETYFKNGVRFAKSKTESIIKWIAKNEIMEEIFVESAHPELIKKAKPLALLMASKNKLKESILEVIWQKAMENQEDLSETKDNSESEETILQNSEYKEEPNSDDNIYHEFL